MRHLGIDTLSVRVGADGDGKKPTSKKQSRAKRARVETAPTRRSTRATSGRVGRGPVVDDVSEEALRALGETAAARRVRLALETRDSRDSRESGRNRLRRRKPSRTVACIRTRVASAPTRKHPRVYR
jgi:hypothetical protein